MKSMGRKRYDDEFKKSSGVIESEREELKRLRKENAVQRTEREALEEATAFFAKIAP